MAKPKVLISDELSPRAVEIFSERDWWQRDPDEVLRTMQERYLRCS